MPKKVVSPEQEEAYRIAQEWAKEVNKSLIAKGWRVPEGEPEGDGDIVEEVKKVIVEVSEKTSE